jgi:serine/threonine protein kinase
LGSGANGIAWLAQHNGTELVVKALRNHTETSRKQFIHETLMMNHLQGNYLVKFYGICLPSASLIESSKIIDEKSALSNELVLLMEYAPLGDLAACRSTLRNTNLGVKIKIALDLARGLLALHSFEGLKFIHRDVRSPNVFIFSFDETKIDDEKFVHCKLGDLGIVTIASPTCYEEIGNWQYMAPEAFNGAYIVGYSPSVDVYSFGIVLWEIFTCETPFQEFMQMGNHHIGKKKILEGFRPAIPKKFPKPLEKLVTQCWAAEADSRPSFAHIVSELEKILLLNALILK